MSTLEFLDEKIKNIFVKFIIWQKSEFELILIARVKAQSARDSELDGSGVHGGAGLVVRHPDAAPLIRALKTAERRGNFHPRRSKN